MCLQFGVLWAGEIRNQTLFLVFAFLSGFGGGALYPLFATLVPDYFGENNNASNYGMVSLLLRQPGGPPRGV